MAGNVNVVNPPMLNAAMRTLVAPGTTSDTYSVGNVREQNYFEYHLYTVKRPTTILDKQTKQITLLSAGNVPVRKTLELRGGADYYRSYTPDLGDRLPIGVYVTFQNRGGSDKIDHTPRNETVRLHLGDSFDVTARKRQTEFHFLPSPCTGSVSSYEIALANAKPVVQAATWLVHVPPDGRTILDYTARVTWCS